LLDKKDLMKNNELLKHLGLKNIKKDRYKLKIEQCADIFNYLFWQEEYGGEKWGEICLSAIYLKNKLPVTSKNIIEIISCIDALNDLEHNNNLYLANYTTFNLFSALVNKFECEENVIYKKSSKYIKNISEEINRIWN
jgi:hypothetical protein